MSLDVVKSQKCFSGTTKITRQWELHYPLYTSIVWTVVSIDHAVAMCL